MSKSHQPQSPAPQPAPVPAPKPLPFLKRLNKTVKDYQPIIQTTSIIVGIIILGLTCWTAWLSSQALRLSLRQDADKQLPIWNFEVQDSAEVIRLKPFNPDIKIQYANAYFSKKAFSVGNWPIDPPDFDLHLTVFKADIAEMIRKEFPYDKNNIKIFPRSAAPVMLEINYIQYGQARTVYGLFEVQFIVVDGSYEPKVQLQGLLFLTYLSKEKALQELENGTTVFKDSLLALKKDTIK